MKAIYSSPDHIDSQKKYYQIDNQLKKKAQEIVKKRDIEEVVYNFASGHQITYKFDILTKEFLGGSFISPPTKKEE